MNQANIEDAVKFYRDMTPEGIDHIRALTIEEVVAMKVVLEITAPPAKKKRADAGVPRKKAAG